MFTPQEIQEQTFSKAVFGGYDMQQVDDFLASGSESSQSAAKGFAQGSGIDVHASVGAVLFAYAVSRKAYHAGGV